jgi:S1-C subfamily serine protease
MRTGNREVERKVSEVSETTRSDGGAQQVQDRFGSGPARSEPWPGHDAGFPAPPGHEPWPAPPSGRPPRRPSALIAAFVAVLLVIGAGLGVWLIQGPKATPTASSGSRGASSGSVVPAAAASAAIVDINTASSFGISDGLRPLGAGTGMILSSSGEVLTNNHVIAGASSIEVSIEGRSASVAAEVIGVDPTDDVALLQLQGVSGLPTVKIGDSSALHVGDPVTAIGNAFGRGGPPTVTTGSVTALDRSIVARNPSAPDGADSEHLTGVIQTDAEIHPGDSGGALVNASGEVVGIITAGPSSNNANASAVGFAIPSSSAMGIVNQMRSGEESSSILLGERGFLGVQVGSLTRSTAAQLGVQPGSGALVVGLLPNSPAAKAGMAAPAVIQEVDGHAISSIADLGPAIHAHTPGEQVEVRWVDRQGSHMATVSLIAGPAV